MGGNKEMFQLVGMRDKELDREVADLAPLSSVVVLVAETRFFFQLSRYFNPYSS